MSQRYEPGLYSFKRADDKGLGELIMIYDGADQQQYWHYLGSRTPYVVFDDFSPAELTRLYREEAAKPAAVPPSDLSVLRHIGATLRLIGEISEHLDAQEIVHGVTTHLSSARAKLEELRAYCAKDA